MSLHTEPPGVAADQAEQEARRDRLLAIGEIAAEVAHELRNALQIVSANVYLARQHPTAPEPHLAKIERSTRIAQGIVEDLMALARGEAVHAEALPATDLLSLGREWLGGPGQQPLPSFEDEVDPAVEVRIHVGLGSRLLHVLYENAIKAKATRITTRVQRVPVTRAVQIEISDDGAGVPVAIRETLFEPLVSARAGGSGLGLALARRIVSAHHGRIALVGPSTFRIELPE